jgi:6-phosphogluconolactonase
MNDLSIYPDPSTLADSAAATFCALANNAMTDHGKFVVALSGGRTPKALYELLATDERYRESVSWKDVYFFFGDERHVLPDHADSNFRMANETLFKNIPVPAGNIFRVPAELADASDAASRYQQALAVFFALNSEIEDNVPVFDLILLGMGPDGHTASLFPETTALDEKKKWVAANWVAKFASWRITLTFPVINHARAVAFLVTGRDKAPIIKKIFNGSGDSLHYPVQRVDPQKGHKIWFLDQDASYLLNGETKAEPFQDRISRSESSAAISQV